MSVFLESGVLDSESSTQPKDITMASFARSFKPSPFLSPRCRPALPGRTLSNSSELSLASNHSARSEDIDEAVTSAPNTPGFFGVDHRATGKAGNDVSTSYSSNSSQSRPIAIELPNSNQRTRSTSTQTPPAPLSGRGDLPGGYFPLHEDPKARVHRPHPFYQDSKLARHRSITLAAESGPMHEIGTSPQPPATATVVDSNMPVASYYPAGFHDSPLPMGKYYPSNYEQRNKSRQNSQASMPQPTWSVQTPDSGASQPMTPSSPPKRVSEAERRRKMLQYQRDMIAQATMALGSQGRGSPHPGFMLKGMPMKDLRFATSGAHKPHSPKLAPLGSPGPVTPMDLEAGGHSSYLDKGRGSDLRA
jgi:hypothetical protein